MRVSLLSVLIGALGVAGIVSVSGVRADDLVPEEGSTDEQTPHPLRRGSKPGDAPKAAPTPAPTAPTAPTEARSAPRTESRAETRAEATGDPHWFVNLGAGYGALVYNPFYQAIANYQATQGGAGYVFGGDLGVYHSFLARNTMLGVVGRGIMDLHPGGSSNSGGYAVPSATGAYIYQVNVAASAMQFLGSAPASGFYLRGDLGYSFVGVGSTVQSAGSTGILSGMGVLGGLGYGVNLATHVRMLVGGSISSILFLPDSPLTNFQGGFSFMLAF